MVNIKKNTKKYTPDGQGAQQQRQPLPPGSQDREGHPPQPYRGHVFAGAGGKLPLLPARAHGPGGLPQGGIFFLSKFFFF